MTKGRKWAWGCGTSVAILLVCGWALLRAGEDLEGPKFHAWREGFKRVKPGMSQAEMLALMGDPTSRSPRFRLAQAEHFEKEYDRAQASNSREWWVWETGDFVFTVGIGQDGRVTMVSSGGT